MCFKENMTLYLPFSFYSSVMFVTEAVFISEQIEEHRFGVLLEINSKLSAFSSNMILLMIMIMLWLNIS